MNREFDAIVLAGGASRRFGADKTRHLLPGGRTLLDQVLEAVQAAERVVVVGDERPLAAGSPAVTWVREEPTGSGPAQAVVAALPQVRAPHVVLLAADLPHVTTATVERLLDAAEHRATCLVDPDGRLQTLCAAIPARPLRQAAARRPDWAGASVRSLLAPLRLVPLPAEGREAHDVDEPDDLEDVAPDRTS